MNDLKQVGERIKKARKEKGISQIKLAEMVGISTSHMSDIENGKTSIGLDIFMRITEALQISADWLLQTDIPSVNQMQNKELDDLLSGCSSTERQAIIEIVKQMCSAFQTTK